MKNLQTARPLLGASLTAHAVKLDELAVALGDTPTSARTAALGLFFGPTVVGYRKFVAAIDLDLDRALLGGHEVTWQRPFAANEPVEAVMTMVEHSQKNGMEFGTFETRFSTPAGELIQTQRTTFVERAATAKPSIE
ncbi:MAG: hypothetical protein JWQ11_2338 [Rhizobacter sp.]|nr:hypothetical protein [Rhizobacter sp.]